MLLYYSYYFYSMLIVYSMQVLCIHGSTAHIDFYNAMHSTSIYSVINHNQSNFLYNIWIKNQKL